MGRKSKRSKAASNENGDSGGLSKSQRKELMDLTKQLLEKCVKPSEQNEWGNFLEIHDLVEKVRKLQEGHNFLPEDRETHFPVFLTWLKDNGVDTTAVSIRKFEHTGYGLEAKKEVQESQLLLTIPRKLMLTTESAKLTCLGSLVESDPLLQSMPTVVLALHLLIERCDVNSLWRPYIDTLPESFSTPLYFTPDEIQLLKGSPVMSEVLKQYKHIARQYAYLHKLFQGLPDGKCPLKHQFTYDDYRWAVSAIMTRQNQIPTPDGQQMINALIPFWDMCNHTNGQFTTDYNLEKDCSECFALRNFKEGEQIYIFYGSRSNAQLLLYSGFVFPDNQNDTLDIKLGISKNDPLYTLKINLLTKLGIIGSGMFSLYRGDQPVDSKLLAFLRIFNMNEEQLKQISEEECLEKLGDLESDVSQELEQKVWSFLETRCSLLLRSYQNFEDNGKISDGDTLSDNARLCLQLRICEKSILQRTLEFAKSKKEKYNINGSA
ncbi:histone-lysine N-methyltransferase setd3 [Lingula anatina]|uniref:protein-histidine N-methyltransferase n=1 Tax=Lingula anatina TaxID=7574 RepID=A0A1S3IK48_LINAN|nr:histone-lysine N-methyltransferase setd3 [Lingula anatina]|eukprot:XP_013398256.1 histone-lysine N-methyltransferase setd3 [Lingula anatina]